MTHEPTSFHATFRHYAKESPLPCCLLAWQKETPTGSRRPSRVIRFYYFVKSKGFHLHIDPDQILGPDDAVAGVLGHPNSGVVPQQIILKDQWDQSCAFLAESFSNTYNAFTLIFRPESKSRMRRGRRQRKRGVRRVP